MNTVFTRFTALISSTFGVPEYEITPQSTFANLELDSIDLAELGMAVEDEFGIKIPDGALSGHDTLTRAVELIAAELNDGPASDTVSPASASHASGGAP